MLQQKAKIIKVLSLDGIPKHNNMWMRDITYYRDEMIAGRSAVLFYEENTRMIITSNVVNIREDEYNLIITTLNSVYSIMKLL